MSSKSRPLTEEERADLVAYLDGELVGEAKRTVETRVNLDPTWRAEADALKRTWELLDYLPRPEPSADFTQRTLSLLEPIGPSDQHRGVGARWRLARWLPLGIGWAAAGALAAAVGYRAALPPRPPLQQPGEQELLRDLRVIENKHYYDMVDDIDFLKQLDNPDLFGDEGIGG